MNEDLVYIDESGIDDNEFYKYGWSEKGKRLFDNKPAYKIKRMSIIGSLNKGKLKALWAFEGHCNSKIFESYVKNKLIPVLKRGQIIVLDNVTFHKSKLTQQLIENAGCKLLFLPPYSPNLNPIEHFWFAIKHNIRKILPNYWPNIKKAIDFVFQDMSKHYFS
ncbi:IS630 family transposase [Spiroplasma endosymbiont of Melieria omissa]|uniref:IS630 family transposase n=1 Tax=Spiroplasma endosymbiont of Melieria omissa TaxID=3139324 RepID=UPI003CCA71B1